MALNVNDISSRLETGIDRGINYLYEHQLPNGEFTTYYSPDDEMKEWCVPDSTVFSTSVIGSCLLQLKDRPKVEEMNQKAISFLRYQMMGGGVWNFFTKWNPIFKTMPADLDSTALASDFLRELDAGAPDNLSVFLNNRTRKGLFYTWIVIRARKYPSLQIFKVMARELKRPFHTLAFWVRHEAGRNDLDAVVNANILYYLGYNEFTRLIPDFLLDVLHQKREDRSDKWYMNPYTFYYFLSRNFGKVRELEAAKSIILNRLLADIDNRGRFGSCPMNNALAIITLINMGHDSRELEHAIEALIDDQETSGCWVRHIFFYAGPSKVVGWGSEETVTAFAVEALAAYRKMITGGDSQRGERE